MEGTAAENHEGTDVASSAAYIRLVASPVTLAASAERLTE